MSRQRGMRGPTPDQQDQITAALIGLDQIASDCEQRWGVGRLLRLCRDNVRLSFRKGWTQWHEASAAGDADRMLAIIPGLIHLWRMADAQATADGHQLLTPDVWEVRMGDGRVLAIARTNAEAIAAQREGRATVAYSLAEVARLLQRIEIVDAIKRDFPGSIVERAVPRSESFAESWATSDYMHEMLHENEGVGS